MDERESVERRSDGDSFQVVTERGACDRCGAALTSSGLCSQELHHDKAPARVVRMDR